VLIPFFSSASSRASARAWSISTTVWKPPRFCACCQSHSLARKPFQRHQEKTPEFTPLLLCISDEILFKQAGKETLGQVFRLVRGCAPDGG